MGEIQLVSLMKDTIAQHPKANLSGVQTAANSVSKGK